MGLQEILKGILEEDFLNKALLLSMAGGLVAIATIYGKQLFSLIYGRISRLIVFSVKIEQTDELFWYLERWLFDNYRHKYRNVIAYTGVNSSVEDCIEVCEDAPKVTEPAGSTEDKKNTSGIKLRQESDTIVINYRGSYVKIFKGRDKLENSNSLSSLFFDSFTLKAIFSTNKIKALLREVEQYSISLQEKNKTNKLYAFDGYCWGKIGDLVTKSIDNVIIPNEFKTSLLDDVKKFENNYDWYKKRDIPYKRGYLFHGPPGNGKTSLALALARHLKRDICILNLSELSQDSNLTKAFHNLKEDSILLLEDIDVLFDTKRKLKQDRVSFSTLLNCLDGVFYKQGSIVIMTTNHKEKLDKALIRAGRIDMQLCLDNPETPLIKEYIDNFYGIDIELNGEVEGKGLNMADVQNLCLEFTEDNIKKELAAL